MEQYRPLLHRQPRPLFQGARAGQELDVLLAKQSHALAKCEPLRGLQRLPDQVLHLVVGDGEHLRNLAVGHELV